MWRGVLARWRACATITVLGLLTDLIHAASAGVHAEARHVARTEERLLVRDCRVDRVDTETTEGIGADARLSAAKRRMLDRFVAALGEAPAGS